MNYNELNPDNNGSKSTVPRAVKRLVHNTNMPRLHRCFGIIHVCLGAFILLLGVVGIFVNDGHYIGFGGVVCGPGLIATGIVQVIAAKGRNHCFLLACLVIDLTLAIFLIIWVKPQFVEVYNRITRHDEASMSFLSTKYAEYPEAVEFNITKAIIIALVCLCCAVSCVIHAAFTFLSTWCKKTGDRETFSSRPSLDQCIVMAINKRSGSQNLSQLATSADSLQTTGTDINRSELHSAVHSLSDLRLGYLQSSYQEINQHTGVIGPQGNPLSPNW